MTQCSEFSLAHQKTNMLAWVTWVPKALLASPSSTAESSERSARVVGFISVDTNLDTPSHARKPSLLCRAWLGLPWLPKSRRVGREKETQKWPPPSAQKMSLYSARGLRWHFPIGARAAAVTMRHNFRCRPVCLLVAQLARLLSPGLSTNRNSRSCQPLDIANGKPLQ